MFFIQDSDATTEILLYILVFDTFRGRDDGGAVGKLELRQRAPASAGWEALPPPLWAG